MRRFVTVALLALVATACHSPFGKAPPEVGPDAGKVGRGIHGWPLLEYAPHGAGWRTDVVWPAYGQVRTEGDGLNETDVLWPIFHHATEGKRTRQGILRPLFDLETDGDGTTYDLDLLWPIFKWKDTPKGWERRIFPIYWASEDEDGDGERHVWPFWGRETRGSWERTWIGAPLFASTTDEENDVAQTDLFFPILHWGHDGDESAFRALPLVWHEESPGEHTTVIFPVIWDSETDDSKFRMVFPFYGHYTEDDGDETVSVGGPLYVSGTQGDEEFTWLAAPLVHWRTSPDGWGAHVFPVLWIDRDEDGDGYTNLWPLFGWKTSGSSTTASIANPFLTYEWDDDSYETYLPWPIVGFQGDATSSSGHVFPLFSYETRESHSDGSALLFVAQWESNEEADMRDFRVLWRLFESSRRNGKDTLVLNPLFRHETNDDGDSYWSFLFGLIARKQEAGETDWRFLWVL